MARWHEAQMMQEMVFICCACGRGFLRYPGEFDITPVWGWTAEIKSGGPCGGTVVKASRAMVIRNLDREWNQDDQNSRKDR